MVKITKNTLKLLYTGFCNIYEYESFIDENTFIKKQKSFLKYENVPCRVSYYKNSYNFLGAKENLFNNSINQRVKIFLDNDIQIKAGSLIVVTQNGKTTKYKNSGEPVVYTSHQEIMLDIFDNIA